MGYDTGHHLRTRPPEHGPPSTTPLPRPRPTPPKVCRAARPVDQKPVARLTGRPDVFRSTSFYGRTRLGWIASA